MKSYLIYIKSHCEAPDYEDTCEAESKEEALKIFCQRLNQNPGGDYWSPDMIANDVVAEEDINQ